MSDYGLEIFNSSGQLVFSSRHKTPRVLAMGEVDLSTLGWGSSVVISFPPVSVRPQFYAEIRGSEMAIVTQVEYIPPDDWYPFPRYNSHRRLYYPYIGPFGRNSSGFFSSITIGMYLRDSWTEYNQVYPPLISTITNKNYVVFV